MRSNMFANVEYKVKTLGEDLITELANESIRQIAINLESFPDNTKTGIVFAATKIGVGYRDELNAKEKKLIKEVFNGLINGTEEQLYEIIGFPLSDNDFEIIQILTQLGNGVAMPLLHFILCVAYIDGHIDDEVAEKLDGIFGINLMADFFQSGMEEVPVPPIEMSPIEADIVSWFEKDDELHSFDEIVANFSYYSKQEVKDALDSLSDKGIIFGGESIAGNMYGLA